MENDCVWDLVLGGPVDVNLIFLSDNVSWLTIFLIWCSFLVMVIPVWLFVNWYDLTIEEPCCRVAVMVTGTFHLLLLPWITTSCPTWKVSGSRRALTSCASLDFCLARFIFSVSQVLGGMVGSFER